MLVDISDHIADEPGEGIMRDKALYLLSNLGFALIGIIYQSTRVEGAEMPSLVKSVLYPAVYIEAMLNHVDDVFGVKREELHQLLHVRKPPIKGLGQLDHPFQNPPNRNRWRWRPWRKE